MLMKKLLFCFFMSLLMVASAVAQTRNITVRGKVIDKDLSQTVHMLMVQLHLMMVRLNCPRYLLVIM